MKTIKFFYRTMLNFFVTTGLLLAIAACAGSLGSQQQWKAPASLPPVPVDEYDSGPKFTIPAKSMQEARDRVLHVITSRGFIRIHDYMSSNEWKCYTAFKDMENLIPRLPYHEVVTSVLFTISLAPNGYDVQLQHCIAFYIKKVDDCWRMENKPELRTQVLEYLRQFEEPLQAQTKK